MTEKLVRKGCKEYLPYVHDTTIMSSVMEAIHTVRDFQDIFLDELSRLPLNREVNVLPRTTLEPITPYCMEPKELKKLKV